MRYHSNLPLRSLSPTLSSERVLPPFKLPAGNISAGTTLDTTVPDPDAMNVDLPTHHRMPIMTLPESGENGSVPFPTERSHPRTHSPLCPLATSLEIPNWNDASKGFERQASYGPASPIEYPSRKRRTAVLRPATKHNRHCQSSSLPGRISSSSSSSRYSCLSSVPSVPLAPSLLFSGSSLSHSTALHAPVITPPSTPMISDLIAPVSIVPSQLASFRHRKPTAGEMKVLLCLYRTLVYGLEIRYPNRPRSTALTEASPRVRANSILDVQDAILAQNLKMYLLENGADIYTMIVDVHLIAREGPQPMRVDTSDSDEPESHSHPHLHASATGSILSYQQLVSSLIARHRMYPSRSQARSSGSSRTQGRKRSTLAECVTLDYSS